MEQIQNALKEVTDRLSKRSQNNSIEDNFDVYSKKNGKDRKA